MWIGSNPYARAFKVATDSKGLSNATFANVTTVQSLDVSDADFDKLVVRVISGEK
jgi:hypothetical protein